MKTRLSACAAETPNRSPQTRTASKTNADEIRMDNTGEGIRDRPSDKPKALIMINHDRPTACQEPAGRPIRHQISPKQGLDAVPRAGTWWNHERSPRHLQHLPRDY